MRDIVTRPMFLLDINELLDIFGMFLLVLIGVELLETVKRCLSSKTVHVEVVFTVDMNAQAWKVIILDIKEGSSLTLTGKGVSILALSTGCFLLEKRRGTHSA